MATKKKNADVTPVAQSSSIIRSSNALSPIVFHQDIQDSNDRLAKLVEAVRRSEIEKARLNAILQSMKTTSDREKTNITKMYEVKLIEVGKRIDKLSSEKTTLELDVERLWHEKVELQEQFDAKNIEVQSAEEGARFYKTKFYEAKNNHNESVAERKKSLVKSKSMKIELNKIRKQVVEYQTKLGVEATVRVELENKIWALQEEIKLKDQIHTEELNNSSSVIPVSSGLTAQFKVSEELKQLRNQLENDRRFDRNEIVSSSDAITKNELSSLKRENKMLKASLSRMCDRMDAKKLEQLNSSLHARIGELQASLDDQVTLIIESEAEMARLREEIQIVSERYQNLINVTMSNNVERAVLDNLLCTGEHFLKIEPPAKRRRNDFETVNDYAVTSSSSGSIEISELYLDQSFVKLHNKGEVDLPIGGWKLIRTAGGNEIVHQFDCSDKINGGADLIIWSADNNDSASFGDISMDSQNWCFADEMKMTLVNGDGNVEATVERIQKKRNGGANNKCILM